MLTRVSRPWSVQIEPVEGCTRLCSFCGLNGIRSGPGSFQFMELATTKRIATGLAALAPMARVELAMHGEPMKHPNIISLVRTLRQSLSRTQLQITTNGFWMLGRSVDHCVQRVMELFLAGVDFFMLDTYQPERSRLRSKARAMGRAGVPYVVDLYKDLLRCGVSPYHNHRRRLSQTIVLVDDLAVKTGDAFIRKIHNHAGNNPSVPIVEEPLQKKCTNPFRELAICWNGNVCICCMDFGQEYVCGNVRRESVTSIWYGDKFEAARRMLYHRQRLFTPCARCDVGSGTRVGLLPKYRSPDPRDHELIRSVVYSKTKTNRLPSKVLV